LGVGWRVGRFARLSVVQSAYNIYERGRWEADLKPVALGHRARRGREPGSRKKIFLALGS